MFLDKYINQTYLDIIYTNYNQEYLNMLDEKNFLDVYNVFIKYNFYFIDDIILNYLEIFELDPGLVEEKIIELKKKLGNDFNYIIGHNMTLLNEILEY